MSGDGSERLHGEDTEPRPSSLNTDGESGRVGVRVLLWTSALRGRKMSLPGVFGANTYGLVDRGGTAGGLLRGEPSDSSVCFPGVAGALAELNGVQTLVSSLPGVLGTSW